MASSAWFQFSWAVWRAGGLAMSGVAEAEANHEGRRFGVSFFSAVSEVLALALAGVHAAPHGCLVFATAAGATSAGNAAVGGSSGTARGGAQPAGSGHAGAETVMQEKRGFWAPRF